ncbi:MAG: DUF6326 family protein [Thermoplasmata archaeon]|nr:DUF6326 family protein [Thermoplasmata archaeon]
MFREMQETRSRLSLLWAFATFNYIYADVVILYDKAGTFHYSQGFSIGAAILVEVPMAMVLLSRLLSYRPGRWLNIVAGGAMTAIQAATLFVTTPAPYYAFFTVMEVATTLAIVGLAWKWREDPVSPAVASVQPRPSP